MSEITEDAADRRSDQEQDSIADLDDPKVVEILDLRTVAGLALGGGAVLAAFAGFAYAAASLADLAQTEPRTEQHAHFLMALLAAKAVVSGAFLTFCYALGRAGERFLIPHWWVRTEADRRIAMGSRDQAPSSPGSDVVKGATDLAKVAADSLKSKKP